MDKRIPPIQCILDARHPVAGSAHQKLATIYKDGILHAFCGGIDLAHDRWDDPTHSSLPGRQYDLHLGGWHDVHCYILGPACRDLDTTFRERWNDPRRPRALDASPPRIMHLLPQEATPDAGHHHVQILRTYACNNGYPFALQGEFSARRAYLQAISLAQDYIYIEDQFFTSYEIADALKVALKKHPFLQVIVLVPEAPEPPCVAQNNFHQNVLLNQLTTEAPDRFACYHLQTLVGGRHQHIYVHAKVMIIDDVWVNIGSMNCNRRSTTHDLEVCAAVIDSMVVDGVCKFARELRLDLWSEHLQLPRSHPSLLDPISGFQKWRETADIEGERVKPHMAALPRHNRIWGEVDPVGICKGEPSIPPK